MWRSTYLCYHCWADHQTFQTLTVKHEYWLVKHSTDAEKICDAGFSTSCAHAGFGIVLHRNALRAVGTNEWAAESTVAKVARQHPMSHLNEPKQKSTLGGCRFTAYSCQSPCSGSTQQLLVCWWRHTVRTDSGCYYLPSQIALGISIECTCKVSGVTCMH